MNFLHYTNKKFNCKNNNGCYPVKTFNFKFKSFGKVFFISKNHHLVDNNPTYGYIEEKSKTDAVVYASKIHSRNEPSLATAYYNCCRVQHLTEIEREVAIPTSLVTFNTFLSKRNVKARMFFNIMFYKLCFKN